MEEQKGILNCYSGTKEEVIRKLQKSITFIEEPELKEMSEDFLRILHRISEKEYDITRENAMIDPILYEEVL